MEIIVYLVPCLVTAIFSAILSVRRYKTLAVRFLVILLLTYSAFFLFDAFVMFPHTDSTFKVFAYIFNAYLVPSVPMWLCFLTWALTTTKQRFRKSFLFFFSIPIALLLLELCNYTALGWDTAAEFYANHRVVPAECTNFQRHVYGLFEYIAIDVYNIVASICFIASLIFIIVMMKRSDMSPMVLVRFLFHRGPIRPVHLVILLSLCQFVYFGVRIALQSTYLGTHPLQTSLLCIFSASAMVGMGCVGLVLYKPALYLNRPHDEPEFEDMPVKIFDPDEFRRTGQTFYDSYDDEADTYRAMNLRDGFNQLMTDKKAYLYPGISLYYVSQVLCMRVDRMERIIHLIYHGTYEGYVMVQRIEYCRRYRAKYPDEPLVSVAMVCGFPSCKQMLQEWRECQMFFDAGKVHTASKETSI